MAAPQPSPVDQLKALWARLNADPNAARPKSTNPDWLVLQWEPQGLSIVEANVGDQVTLKRVVELPWGGASNPEDSTASAGSLLRERLAGWKIGTKQTAVILGRDAVVVRRLELPYVPDNDLPDMVRFQASTKASTPIDRLALDFVPLDTPPDAPRIAVTATMDASRLRMIQEVVIGAGLELVAVGLSATSTAELVSRVAPAGSLSGVVLVLLQKGENLELTLLDGGRLAFAHSIRLEVTEGGPAIQPLQAELNRALVAMSQVRPDASVSRAFVVPGAGLNPAVQEMLDKRFPGAVQRVDPRESAVATALSAEESTFALRVGPAVGQLLGVQKSTLPAIDFVNPRKRIEPPDTRKAKIRAIGGGVAILALLGIWMNMNAASEREAQLAAIEGEAATINETVNKGKPISDAAVKLKRWRESDPRPLEVLEKMTGLLPPTSDMLLTEIDIKPAKPATGPVPTTVAGIKAFAWSRTDDAITAFANRLAAGGYSIESPTLPDTNRFDPDYPLLYTLVADQLVPQKPPAARPAPAATPK